MEHFHTEETSHFWGAGGSGLTLTFPLGAPSLEEMPNIGACLEHLEGCPSPAAYGTPTSIPDAQLSYPCLGALLPGGRGG